MTTAITEQPPFDPTPLIAEELKLPRAGVAAVTALLADGSTVPFIARYRKEATGGLDEVAIRNIEERRSYLLDLDRRRKSVLAEIGKQGKLTDILRKKILTCPTKAGLEDLYAPYRPKRRTRGMIATERGLLPLAECMWSQAPLDPEAEAAKYVDAEKEVEHTAAALAGARDICAERVADDANVRKLVRETFTAEAIIAVGKTREHKEARTKFDDYAEHSELASNMPAHRFLAVRRGEGEGVLRASVSLEGDRLVNDIQNIVGFKHNTPWAKELKLAAEDGYKRLLATRASIDLRVDMKMAADRAAVDIFASNLQQLLLAAPFGQRAVLGVDPGQRTGCKCAVVDETGRLVQHDTIYLVQGKRAEQEAAALLLRMCRTHKVSAVAVGNGTHGRETESFVRDTLRDANISDVVVVSVNEAGASIYSASDIAREEMPDVDLTVRGAVSIARRLQDPLAELVKLDPKSIGVGQYQHDVHQPLLAKKLDEVVEHCVNAVGVELNTASASLLARVAGVGSTVAKRLIAHRDAKGPFPSRKAILKVTGVGPRTFEQAAGFLRVRDGEHALDGSAVHPERYALVERMAKDLGVPVASLVGRTDLVERIDSKLYADEAGRFTLNDIINELKKPGRDPRAVFEAPNFRDDVRTMNDLEEGMELEGVVTNVVAFGAFVDVGVHQDGLVHISQLADRFIKEASEAVSVGDRIKVTVMSIDMERKRIGLSARKDAAANVGSRGGQSSAGNQSASSGDHRRSRDGQGNSGRGQQRGGGRQQRGGRQAPAKFSNNPFAKLLSK